MSLKTLKWAAILCFVVAMAVLLGGGIVMKKDLPPYPGKVVDPGGKVLFEKANIIAGQDVYQRYGLMDQGAVWGHGSQRGPEFSAASLNLIADAIGDYYARKDYGKSYKDLDALQKGLIDVKIAHETKTNRYDAATDTLRLTAAQVEGLNRVKQYWGKIFSEGMQRYGFLPDTIKEENQRLEISRFFFWTAWVASTLRPGTDYSYTNNWPPDKRVGNVASTATYFYSIAGIISLLLVLGLFVFWIHRYGLWYGQAKGVALAEKLIEMPLTSSQLHAAKFFVVVILLFLVQTTIGRFAGPLHNSSGQFFLSVCGRSYSLQPGQNLASAADGFLDCHHLAGVRHLPRSHHRRQRTGQAGCSRHDTFRRRPAGCGGQPYRRGSGYQGYAREFVVLAGPSGMGIS